LLSTQLSLFGLLQKRLSITDEDVPSTSAVGTSDLLNIVDAMINQSDSCQKREACRVVSRGRCDDVTGEPTDAARDRVRNGAVLLAAGRSDFFSIRPTLRHPLSDDSQPGHPMQTVFQANKLI
jgi:hypothetical protein